MPALCRASCACVCSEGASPLQEEPCSGAPCPCQVLLRAQTWMDRTSRRAGQEMRQRTSPVIATPHNVRNRHEPSAQAIQSPRLLAFLRQGRQILAKVAFAQQAASGREHRMPHSLSGSTANCVRSSSGDRNHSDCSGDASKQPFATCQKSFVICCHSQILPRGSRFPRCGMGCAGLMSSWL
jgi:hypothetical protein